MVARTKSAAPRKLKKAFKINALFFTFRVVRQMIPSRKRAAGSRVASSAH